MVEIENKGFIDVVLIMPCKNPLWIMGSMIYGERRIKVSLCSPTMIDPLAQNPGNRVYTEMKSLKNTNINHIMVSFTDHYNAISSDRLLLQNKV